MTDEVSIIILSLSLFLFCKHVFEYLINLYSSIDVVVYGNKYNDCCYCLTRMQKLPLGKNDFRT